MAYFSGLGVDRVSGGKHYLKGYVKGCEAGYKYCLYWGYGDTNMPSSGQNYTFFGGPGNLNLKSQGCYLPTDAQGSYPVAVKMVGSNCEDVHVVEDTAYVTTPDEPDPDPDPVQKWLTVIARDQNSAPVSGVPVKVNGSSKGSTGSDGSLSVLLDANQSYSVTGTAPSGYECVVCTQNVVITNYDVLVTFALKEEAAPPNTCITTIRVSDQDDASIVGAAVCIPNAEGPDCKVTNSSGIVEFELIIGDHYIVSVAALDGYERTAGSTKSFTATYGMSYYLDMRRIDPTCTEGDKRDAELCDDGSMIHNEVCRNDAWVPSGESCPEPDCRIDFLVTEFDPAKRVAGAICHIGGKTATTNAAGVCAITVPYGGTYTATCDPPDNYTCDCGVCKCDESPFTLTGDGGINFCLKKIAGDCQVVFEVADVSEGSVAVPGVQIEVGDETITTDHLGRATIMLPCMTSVAAKCIVPEGYTCETNNCTRVFTPSTTAWVPFAIRPLEPGEIGIDAPLKVTAGHTFKANVAYDPNEGIDVVVEGGITYVILGHCETDALGRCSVDCVIENAGERRIRAQTSPFNTSAWFDILVEKADPGEEDPNFNLTVPKVVLAGDIEISGKAPAGETVYIMAEKSWFYTDLFALDEEITSIVADGNGDFSGTINIEDFGSVTVYAKIKEGWLAHKKTASQTIYVVTTAIVAALMIAVLLVIEKKFAIVGLFGKKRR